MIALLSILFKLAGVIFLCIAALGVMRLPDPFQRMHAATKAGTLGAGLVIIGSVIAHGALDATIMGLFTVIFLLLTVPVAGHLLGRAAYVSGARLALSGEDALDGVLERSSLPLDERLGWLPTSVDTPKTPEPKSVAPQRSRASLQRLEAVRFAVIDGNVDLVAQRASAVAKQNEAKLSAHVLIDGHAIDTAEDPAQMRRLIRDRASKAVNTLKGFIGVDAVLNYSEGDPERLLACDGLGEELLVLPCEGWFHHQVEGRRSLTTWEPDGLLRLPAVHRGPVLFAGKHPAQGSAKIVVRDCGESHLPALVEWALMAQLWPVDSLVHVADRGADTSAVEDIARNFRVGYRLVEATAEGCAVPDDLGDADAVILGATPRPLRTNWFGAHWRSRIAPDMGGDVLIMEAPEGGASA
ncbi:monovalent cation/H(+) antiporter subunit G [Rhizobium sp. EC-SD404]|uniref:monovalent cation/H(+) antiporter subunit G n=1 Tax=Rhizobium sp. EC-SD404 TaxID=2038389 RepID=UPI0012579B3B|nr:monovalent cation/H(+) antiporter subunit G [Rhizobium sp. EC-SD404]VVT08043.1 Monovalent cation/proton antiporter, MnhG/PhaG subunit [Rhizobium sp. EC-SD404]